jgi:hypothetical protein
VQEEVDARSRHLPGLFDFDPALFELRQLDVSLQKVLLGDLAGLELRFGGVTKGANRRQARVIYCQQAEDVVVLVVRQPRRFSQAELRLVVVERRCHRVPLRNLPAQVAFPCPGKLLPDPDDVRRLNRRRRERRRGEHRRERGIVERDSLRISFARRPPCGERSLQRLVPALHLAHQLRQGELDLSREQLFAIAYSRRGFIGHLFMVDVQNLCRFRPRINSRSRPRVVRLVSNLPVNRPLVCCYIKPRFGNGWGWWRRFARCEFRRARR